AVGQHFLSLDIGLAVEQVRPLVRTALGGETDGDPLRLEAVNRRGRTITVRVATALLQSDASAPAGVIILVDEDAPVSG
ncbi:MAG TPA: hypothetical protein VKJ07_00470, partial [Mycobacteriales bacterium]|nr:hypothetical protein [Mycobacteriales bacterium]